MSQLAIFGACFLGFLVLAISFSAFGLWWIGPDK